MGDEQPRLRDLMRGCTDSQPRLGSTPVARPEGNTVQQNPMESFVPPLTRHNTWENFDSAHDEPFNGQRASDLRMTIQQSAEPWSIQRPHFVPPRMPPSKRLSSQQFKLCVHLATAIILRVKVGDNATVDALRPQLVRFQGELHDEDHEAFQDRAEKRCRVDRALQGSDQKLKKVSLRKIGAAIAIIPLCPENRGDAAYTFTRDLEKIFDGVYERDLEAYFEDNFIDRMYDYIRSRGFLQHFHDRVEVFRRRWLENR